MGSMPLTKDEISMLSNMQKYLKQICDAKNTLLELQSSANSYIANTDLPISKNTIEITKVKDSIKSNLSILNKLLELSTMLNDNIHTLWNSYINKDEQNMRYTYNRLKPALKMFIQYIKTNRKNQIQNNTIIHRFLKKAKHQYNIAINETQLKKAKHKKIYQSKLLLITEKKIYLPYKDDEIQKLIDSNTDAKVDDIINKKFVITNIKPFTSSSSHRFTQAYKLCKTKSKKSPLQALKFALKIAKIRNLHPAIIHACNSEDQLENYIIFLNQGNPSMFTDFEVKFQINPI